MGKRAEKKESQSKELHFDLITEEEFSNRENKYAQRLYDIETCNSYVQETLMKYTSALIKKFKHDRWLNYLMCDSLPHVEKPQQIRLFLEKILHFDQIDVDKTIDWTLEIDERSILSQNIERIDLTRNTLCIEKCPDMGSLSDKNISDILNVLTSMDTLLGNDTILRRLPLSRTKDILSLQTVIETEVVNILDRLTYRVLSSKDAYMTSKDGFTADYCYEGKEFQIHIWSLRNPPKRFQHMDLPYMNADMPCTGVKIQIPVNCLWDRMAIRCIHSNFDFYTLYAKSFEHIIDQSTDYIIAGLADMEDSLAAEWKWQLEIIKEIQAKVDESLESYNAAIEKINVKTKSSPKSSSKEAKKAAQKSMKQIKAPMTIPEGMVPDTYNIFIDRAKKQFEMFLNQAFHPNSLNLQPDEINLKKFIIIGGIYEIYNVKAPKHTDYNKFNITSHDPERQLYILKDIVSYSDYSNQSDENKENSTILDFLTEQSKRSPKASTKLEQLSQIKNRSLVKIPSKIEPEPEPPYYYITFQLPQHLCKWGMPEVCQYEEHPTELQEISEVKPEVLFQPSRQSSIMRASSFRFGSDVTDNELSEFSEINHSKDWRASTMKSKSSISISLKRNLGERDVNSFNIFSTPLATHLRNSVLPNPLQIVKLTKNFSFETPITPAQLLIIKRECVPHVISSFKFPTEIKENNILETKNTNKSSILVRKQETNEVVDAFLMERAVLSDFNFDEQHNPERLFPIVPEMNFNNPHLNDLDDDNREEPIHITLFRFLNKIEDINELYRSNKIKVSNSQSGILIRDNKSSQESLAVGNWDGRRSNQYMLRKSRRKSSEAFSNTSIEPSSIHTKGKSFVTIKEKYDHEKQKNTVLRPVTHWTNSHILQTTYDYKNLTVTVKTDRLGIFGFAYKRYEHFPFRFWSLEQKEETPEEYVFILDTYHVQVVLNISRKGYTGYVTDLGTKFVARPFKYLSIDEPITEINELKKLFLSKNFNIFAEPDASIYIENGYSSLKHIGTENHIYDTIALHCPTIKFFHSSWNRLASLRDLVLCLRLAKEKDENAIFTVRVTPEQATFVEVSEICSDDVDVIKLKYTPTWRNINSYSDLHALINSICSYATDERNKNPMLLVYIQTLLNTIRPLSYS